MQVEGGTRRIGRYDNSASCLKSAVALRFVVGANVRTCDFDFVKWHVDCRSFIIRMI
jgi:hypothetical protein